MRIVLDASVALKLVHREPDSHEAERLIDSAETVSAPDFLFIELANVLLRVARQGAFEATEVERAIRSLKLTVDATTLANDLLDEAIAIARVLRHPIYDCIYLALGRRLSAPVLTADVALVRASERSSAWNGAALLLSRASAVP